MGVCGMCESWGQELVKETGEKMVVPFSLTFLTTATHVREHIFALGPNSDGATLMRVNVSTFFFFCSPVPPGVKMLCNQNLKCLSFMFYQLL